MRVSTLSLALICGVAVTAQPVIDFASIDLIGSGFNLYLVTSPGTSDPNADGANVTWDFSSATLQLVGTQTFMPAAGTPYSADHPTANMASAETMAGTTSYTYYDLQSTRLDILANGVGSMDPNVYSEPKTVLEFPYAFNDWFIDYYNENGTDYSVSRAYMGYGTVILPNGTFTNVVKQASTSGAIDFYTTSPTAPLVHIESDGSAVVALPGTVGIQEHGQASALRSFPNPVQDRLTLANDAPLGDWQIMDATGRVAQAGRTGAPSTTIDLSSLAPGSYIARIGLGDRARAVFFLKD